MDVRNERPKEGEGEREREVRRELLVMRDRGGCKERGWIPLTFEVRRRQGRSIQQRSTKLESSKKE